MLRLMHRPEARRRSSATPDLLGIPTAANARRHSFSAMMAAADVKDGARKRSGSRKPSTEVAFPSDNLEVNYLRILIVIGIILLALILMAWLSYELRKLF